MLSCLRWGDGVMGSWGGTCVFSIFSSCSILRVRGTALSKGQGACLAQCPLSLAQPYTAVQNSTGDTIQ